MDWLASFIFFKLLGWRLVGKISPQVNKAVVIVVPHTSWHDFYMGLLVRRVLGRDIKFLAKKELFKPPFGWYFKWMGGTALDRTPGQKKVEAIAQIFRTNENFLLCIAPEGTRKKVLQWKTGFYYIARTAEVPIVMVAFDFGEKTVKVSVPFCTTEDEAQDFRDIKTFYKGVVGKVPENS